MSAEATGYRISRILRLVGPALLLPWPAGSKGGPNKWKHLQLTDMDRDNHQTKLAKAGNIGVALGEVSNGLVTIDLDDDSYANALLTENPMLGSTLQTRGNRGCNIWVRCNGGYPRSQRLKNSSGEDIGEWRADGAQTIVSGIHPGGMPYQFVVKQPVITLSYDAIIWPQVILAPRATESSRVRRVRENEVVAKLSVNGDSSSIQSFASDDLIRQVAPIDFHRNNVSLFKLAQLVRDFEATMGRPVTNEELEFVFDRWCFVARRFWRHTRDEYWAEFLEACHYARFGLNQNPLELALSRARTKPLPEVTGFSDNRVRLLAAICREMQLLVGDSSFFLPTRKLGQLLKAHWASVARWLVNLEVSGVIRLAPGEVRKRGGSRCPRYHYGPRVPKTDAMPVPVPLAPPQQSAATDAPNAEIAV